MAQKAYYEPVVITLTLFEKADVICGDSSEIPVDGSDQSGWWGNNED